MTTTHLDTGFLGTAEDETDGSALISGIVLAHLRQDHHALQLYRVCTTSEIMSSTCLAVAELALSVSEGNESLAADHLYEAVHHDTGEVGAEEHLLSMRMLRATARAVDAQGILDIEMEDFNEVDHLHACIEAFHRTSASCQLDPITAASTIRSQAPRAHL